MNNEKHSPIEPSPLKEGWNSVEEKGYPEKNKGVLVFIPDEDYHITSGMWDVDNKWVLLDEYRVPECSVTHWMDMPKPPKEYQKEIEDSYDIMMLVSQGIKSGAIKIDIPFAPEPSSKEQEAVGFAEWIMKEYDSQGTYWENQGGTYTTEQLYKLYLKNKNL